MISDRLHDIARHVRSGLPAWLAFWSPLPGPVSLPLPSPTARRRVCELAAATFALAFAAGPAAYAQSALSRTTVHATAPQGPSLGNETFAASEIGSPAPPP